MPDSTPKERKLNNEQKRAAETIVGPVLVIAGAGTGKTTVIVERINRLMSKGTSPNRILALTFTEKAAAEMLDRVNESTTGYQLELPIMTFNAYGESLLRRYAADIGLNRNFITLGESAQIVFLRERIDELGLDYFAPIGRPDGLLSDIAGYFSLLKQNVITPDTYSRYVRGMPAGDESERLNKRKHSELASAYDAYLRLSREANVIDYDDQIFLVIELFTKRPNVLKEVQAGYDYIMVDEFQDTNAMQSVLIDLVCAGQKNLFVVGDDDQSIYGWRGATLANILDFTQRYPDAQEITLVQNYRSTREILDSAYRLIRHNNPHRLEERLHINKRLVAQTSGQAPITHSFATIDEELAWIAADIKQRIANGANPGSIAVLARRNSTIQLLDQHLDYAEVEHVIAGQRYELYHEPAVRMLLEGLRTVADPTDNTSLYHTLIGPLFSLSPHQLTNLSATAKRNHESLMEAIDQSGNAELEEARQAINTIKSWREMIGISTVGQLAYEMLTGSGYKEKLYKSAEGDPLAATAASRLAELFKTMKEFERIALQPSVVQYVEALPALQAAGNGGEDGTLDLSGRMVNVLTIHKSKGLEWPVVYIADCAEGSFPLRETARGMRLPDGLGAAFESEANAHMSEERRLMYVAMTRAKDTLILTHAQAHSSGAIRRPSRFIEEAFGEHEFTKPAEDAGSRLRITGFGKELPYSLPIPTTILNDDQVTLSVSQIQSYLECPLNFYYRYILNVPEEPNPQLQYGSLMHNLLEDINRSLVMGKLINYAQLKSKLESQWPKAGYTSVKQRERAFRQAQATLKRVYEQASGDRRIPVAVEEPFSFTLKDARLSVGGRFDAVFPMGSSVEIVDYKTSSSVDTPEKAKQRASGSEQLTLYAMAWQIMHDKLPVLVTLDFIDTGMRGSVKKTQRGIEGAYSRLQTVADDIRAMDFRAGKDHRYCIHGVI
jgi:DNA helicase II / ATP-dependent DNA helicase PcrA